jgi:hypothetical protein
LQIRTYSFIPIHIRISGSGKHHSQKDFDPDPDYET